jgi:hypothetical protein
MTIHERISEFELCPIWITANAFSQICRDDMFASLFRFRAGDWGEVCDEDRQANDEALATGSRILATYTDRYGLKFWILTEGDRSATTILLPGDY